MASALQPFKTPLGSLMWVNHFGEGKPNQSGKLKYNADLALPEDSEEAKALKARIDEFWRENKPANYKRKAKSMGYYDETEKDLDENGEEQLDEDGAVIRKKTGRMIFRFSTDTTYAKSGDKKKVTIFNAKGREVALTKNIGNNSEGNIGGAMGVYGGTKDLPDAGVTLYLNSIRLVKFVEFTGGDDWSEYSDDATEDGFTGDEGWEGEADGNTEAQADDSGANVRL